MAARYLLPCECGGTTPIDMSQAGGSVSCRCGKTLEVPSLRAIRQLTLAPASDESRQRQPHPAAGIIFVVGLLVAMCGGGEAFYMHLNAVRAVDFDLPPEDEVADWIAEVDNAPPQQLFDIWNASRHMGLGDYETSPFVQARLASQRFASYRNVGLIVMACGLAFAGISICLRGATA